MVNAQPYSFNELNGVVISEVLQLHRDAEKGVRAVFCLSSVLIYQSSVCDMQSGYPSLHYS